MQVFERGGKGFEVARAQKAAHAHFDARTFEE